MYEIMSEKPKLPSLSKGAISCQLERMLSSPDFHASPQQTAFLKFVVNRELAGKASEIKGYTVATEVFGRGLDFDQSIDPVVSIQARRLRRTLEHYYLTAGKHDPIRIDIPKGTYVPTYSEQGTSHQDLAAKPAVKVSVMETWPTLLVRPLMNLTANPEDNYLSIGLTAELAHALSHYREIRVLEAFQRGPEWIPPVTGFDFILDGNVRRDPAGIKVAIRLHDATKGFQIWSGKYPGDPEASKMIAFQEDVANKVAVCVAGDSGAISNHLAGISRNKLAPELTSYEAMLRFWGSYTLHTPRSFVRAIQALKHALNRKPDHSQTWSMLASLYAENYSLEVVELPTPLKKAAEFAQRAVSLDPTCRRARVILAYVRLMENKLQEARCEAETAYELCPSSLRVLDAIGWVIAGAGEWQRGVNWIKKAIKLNPYCRPWIRYALCFNWFRLGNYEKAYHETLNFMMPNLFWEPIMKAAALGHLGRNETGQMYIRNLLALKPDFAQRGRILIGRFIKFKNIIDRIAEGLGKLGLNIAS